MIVDRLCGPKEFLGAQMRTALLFLYLIAQSTYGQALVAARDSPAIEQVVQQRLQQVIKKVCKERCELVAVEARYEEVVGNPENMGFDTTADAITDPQQRLQSLTIDMQIDARISLANQEKLESLLRVQLQALAPQSSFRWNRIQVPAISDTPQLKEVYKSEITDRIRRAISGIFTRYCPDQCLLEQVTVLGELTDSVAADQTIYRNSSYSEGFQVNAITIDLAIDEALVPVERQRILRLLEAKTKFVKPVDINAEITPFPETSAQKLAAGDDPYELGRLKEMLTLFRDLAGTKEIITSTESTTNSSLAKTESKNVESKAETSLTATENSTSATRRSDISTDSSAEGMTAEEVAAYGAGLVLLLTLMAIILLKFSRSSKAADQMVAAHRSSPYESNPRSSDPHFSEAGAASGHGVNPGHHQKSGVLGIRNLTLKAELTDLIIEKPKVAKETFSRLLMEDGIEKTAQYVSLFGQVIIFELLSDPALQRYLRDLGEHYHRSRYAFSEEDIAALLTELKTRVTAAEIKVLTMKSSLKFDFLNQLDPGQVFRLIADESVQVQSVVLTQLSATKRDAVFCLFQGEPKIAVLAALSKADSMPKEFLQNVAIALERKVRSRPEFDTENLQSGEILIDLLEKSAPLEQRRMLQSLEASNPQVARSVKSRLVTIDALGYLQDGLIIDVVLDLNRADLLNLLAGCPNHIRTMLLEKAPEELADSWIEDLQAMGGVSAAQYQGSEAIVTSKLRSLAEQGRVNLLAINEHLYRPKGGVAQPRSVSAA